MKIFVHKTNIRLNKTNKEKRGVLCIGDEIVFGCIIYGQDGLEACRVIYDPENALVSGAEVWIETDNEIKLK